MYNIILAKISQTAPQLGHRYRFYLSDGFKHRSIVLGYFIWPIESRFSNHQSNARNRYSITGGYFDIPNVEHFEAEDYLCKYSKIPIHCKVYPKSDV